MVLEQKGPHGLLVQRPVSMAEFAVVGCSVPTLVNLTRVDLASLRLVVVCASVGSLTRAAPICNMSLMTASRRLRMLEEALGCTIFHRRRTSLELINAGLVVFETAQMVVQLLSGMMDRVLCTPAPHGRLHENTGRSTRGTRS